MMIISGILGLVFFIIAFTIGYLGEKGCFVFNSKKDTIMLCLGLICFVLGLICLNLFIVLLIIK